MVEVSVLLIAARDAPPWARSDHPMVRDAVQFTAIAQVLALNLAYPWLLQSAGSAIFVAGCGTLALTVASALAESGAGAPLASEAVWLAIAIALTSLRWAFPARRSQLLSQLLVASLTVGWLTLTYLRHEFSTG